MSIEMSGHYPDAFPQAAIGVIVNTIMHPSTIDKAKVVHACYDVLGYALKSAFGDGTYELIGDAVVPSDAKEQLKTFEAQGLGDKIPSWLVTLVIDLLKKYLLEK